jgi:hypothetical protein
MSKRNPDGTYLAPPEEIEIGDVVVERDGFMWTVTGKSYYNKTYTFEVKPTYPSMTARGPKTFKVRMHKRLIRVLSRNPRKRMSKTILVRVPRSKVVIGPGGVVKIRVPKRKRAKNPRRATPHPYRRRVARTNRTRKNRARPRRAATKTRRRTIANRRRAVNRRRVRR